MKVLLISPLPPPAGGIATWTKLYLKSMKSKLDKINIVNTAVCGSRVNNYTKRNCFDEIKRAIKIFNEMETYIKAENYDIIHINTSCSLLGMIKDYFCLKKFKNKKTKKVIHFHCDTSHMVKGRLSEYFFKKICLIADKKFCLNKSSKEHIATIAKVECVIIPNFFDITIMSNINERNISSQIKNIIYVGHIIKTKGCIDIISVAKQMHNIKFKMVGYLSDEIKAIPVTNNVEYLGEIQKEDVLEEMLKADMLLFPTHTEGFPNVVLEAMACGLPIVSTPVGAISDMIEDKGGEIVNIGDIDGMIRAINKLQDQDLRQQMSKFNREKVRKVYTVENVINKIFKEYSNMLLM